MPYSTQTGVEEREEHPPALVLSPPPPHHCKEQQHFYDYLLGQQRTKHPMIQAVRQPQMAVAAAIQGAGGPPVEEEEHWTSPT